MKNAFGKWSQYQFHLAPPLSANVYLSLLYGLKPGMT